jgi:hypothetical protein
MLTLRTAITMGIWVFAVACSGGGGGTAPKPAAQPDSTADAQTPPAGPSADVEMWLATGSYKSWHCEPAPHANRAPSPHGMNRICSNDLLSAHGAGEFPVGSAGVKEIYDGAGKTVVGYAVYRHIQAGTTGDSWYWYERNGGVIADDVGDDFCVGCHSGAGRSGHSGHDLVYTQVK